jgi:type II secretory pathway pseudopilin PulG
MTLVEVLVATGILVFGMAALMAVIATAQRTHRRAVSETVAVQVAQSVLARWRGAMAKGQLPDPTPPNTPFENLPPDRDYPGYRCAVQIQKIEPRRTGKSAEPLGEEYYVEVKVSWAMGGDEHSAVFRTVMLLRKG